MALSFTPSAARKKLDLALLSLRFLRLHPAQKYFRHCIPSWNHRLLRVEGVSFLSARQYELPCFMQLYEIKTGGTFPDASGKKSLQFDFLRRHYPHQVRKRWFNRNEIGIVFYHCIPSWNHRLLRVEGVSFLSACQYKLPCF